MTTFQNHSVIVIGASSGIGRSAALAFAAEGARVWAVARSREQLAEVAQAASSAGRIHACALDATNASAISGVIAEADPDLIVLTAGARPRAAPVTEHDWESFSVAWNTDVRIAFQVGQAALARPLRPGSTVIIVSSGAALGGSPLSGGYAGAKRMQMFLADYLQKASDSAKLGVRFVAFVPKQLVVGTALAETVRDAYAARAGITPEKFMERFGTPLTLDATTRALVEVARGDVGRGAVTLGMTGKGIEAL